MRTLPIREWKSGMALSKGTTMFRMVVRKKVIRERDATSMTRAALKFIITPAPRATVKAARTGNVSDMANRQAGEAPIKKRTTLTRK